MKTKVKKLKNGTTILYSKNPGYFTNIHYYFDVGSKSETPGLFGAAHLLEHMLFNGSRLYDKNTIVESIDEWGGNINACTDDIYTKYYCKVLNKNAEKAINLLSDMCFAPILDEEVLEKEKKIVIQEYYDGLDSPWSQCYDDGYSKMYNVRPVIGTEDSVNNIKHDDFIEFYKEYYGFDNLIISIVSPLSFKNICSMIENSLCNYYMSYGTKKQSREFLIKEASSHKVKSTNNLDQNKMLISHLVPSEYKYESMIYTQMLGGGMSSRLFNKIREEMKLCYNIGSFTTDVDYCNSIMTNASFNELDKYDDIVYNYKKESISLSNASKYELDRAKSVVSANYCTIDEDSSRLCSSLIKRHVGGLDLSTDVILKKINNMKLDNIDNFIHNCITNSNTYSYLLWDEKEGVQTK